MSVGPRIPLARATAAAEVLFREWKMPVPACEVVGSVRRRKPDVGDLELLAPLPAPPADPKRDDALYEHILATCNGQPQALFGEPRPQFTEVVGGLKRGFLCASLKVQLRLGLADEEASVVPVQIFRYTPENRGWQQLMRTGPREMGIWFLQEWKRVFGIQGGPASIDGHLVDSWSKRVPVEDEQACFRLIRHEPIPPEQRDGFVAHLEAQRLRGEREALR